jgi:Domain of unknown function (DUF1992)
MSDSNSNRPSVEWTQIVAERQIKEAMDRGDFDNLPGKGKPLNLDEDASIPVHQRMMMKVLKNAEALPDWISLEKDIDREYKIVTQIKTRAFRSYHYTKSLQNRRNILIKLRKGYKEQLGFVNTMILKYNMASPVSTQKIYRPFSILKEMEVLEAEIAVEIQHSLLEKVGI